MIILTFKSGEMDTINQFIGEQLKNCPITPKSIYFDKCEGKIKIIHKDDKLKCHDISSSENNKLTLVNHKLDTEFKGFERIYANGQTAGQYGTPHYDDGDLTFLYYPSPVWDTNWQGHLMFMNEVDEVVRVVEHKSNGAVLFPGIIKHYADAPHRWFNGLRISLAYKLWKK